MNVGSFATQLDQIEATRSVLEGRETQLDPSFRIRCLSSEVTVFSKLDWAGDKNQRKSLSAKVAQVGRHLLKAKTRK